MARDVIKLRKRMLPYLYTAFHAYQTQGIPPFRAMVLEEGYTNQESLSKAILDGVKNPYAEQERLEVTDQYMMGPSLLVAPVFWGEEERKVVLPQGNWYDFYTGKFVGNGESITVTTELSKIPLYVKDGGIIPMFSEGDENSLEVRHYGEKTNTYILYNDDGVSYDYEKGAYAQTQLKATTKKGKWKGSAKATGEKAYQYRKLNWVWMGKE
jgi:alpha-D-xyloside xylohydrolase